jgi:hypothetical protein
MIWKPIKEGIDHINIYSKSSERLGRALSNFFRAHFFHPDYGEFQSIEGFYYWLKSGNQHHELRFLYGFKAKEIGMKFKQTRKVDDAFKKEMEYAIALKVVQTPYIQELILDSIKDDLPFAHYYYYGDKYSKPVIRDRSKRDAWLIDAAEKIRIKLGKYGRVIQEGYHIFICQC